MPRRFLWFICTVVFVVTPLAAPQAHGEFRPMHAEGMDLSFDRGVGQMTAKRLLYTLDSGTCLAGSPFAATLALSEPSPMSALQVWHAGEAYQFELFEKFFTNALASHLRGVDLTAESTRLTMRVQTLERSCVDADATTQEILVHCEANPAIEQGDTADSHYLVEACLSGKTSIQIASHSIQPIKDPPFLLRKFIPSIISDIAIDVEGQEFRVSFASDSRMAPSGLITGSLSYDSGQNTLRMELAQVKIGNVSVKGLLRLIPALFPGGALRYRNKLVELDLDKL